MIASISPVQKPTAQVFITDHITNGKDGDADDEGDDHVSDTQDADDEDVETISNEDKIYKYKIRVRKDEDVEMKDAEVKESDKGFGDQFLKLSSDSSLVSTVKDSAYTDVNSFLDIPIQQETPQTQSSSVQKILISVIPETTNLPPIPEIVTETLVSTAVPSPQVTHIISTVQQTTTPISTPPITTDAPTIITVVHESDALSVVELRVAKLEKDVSELKTVDHSSKDFVVLQSQVLTHLPELTKKPTPTTEQESEKIPSDILKIKKEQAEKNPANHRLYHALMETLIMKMQWIRESLTQLKTTRESMMMMKTMMMKTLLLDQTRSASAKEPVEEPIAEVIMDDAGNDVAHDNSPPQDTSEPKTRKTLNPYWFKQPPRPPTPDLGWSKRQVILDQPAQPWFNQMVSASKDPLTFNDLIATPIDFSKFVLNGIKIDNLTQDIFKLDWNNPEGDRYPFDLSKPLPLQGPLGHRTVAADYFFNNDLEYLKTSYPEVTYTTSIMKTKATRYEIKGIEDMVNKFSKQNVYSTKAILSVKSVSVKKLHTYGHLEEIVVKRFDKRIYKFKEGDFVDLHLNDIEDMLILVVQHKLFHLDGNVIVDFIVALRMFTRSLILKRRVEDLQLGVERIVYEDLDKQKRALRVDELYKFSDGTLKSVRDEIHHRVLDFRLDYNTEMPKRKWMAVDRKRSGLMIELIDKQLQNRRDLPRDIPLDCVVVLRYEKRSKSKNKGKVPTEMELVLEQTQQGQKEETLVVVVVLIVLIKETTDLCHVWGDKVVRFGSVVYLVKREEIQEFEEEKARRHGQTFNWQTATFEKVENYEDEDDCFIDFETEFPAINYEGQDMAPLPAADQRHLWLRYQIEEYNEGIRHNYEQRLETI
ncbi:hypothetical protein Tco_1213028 [Tanacetum coccineum]